MTAKLFLPTLFFLAFFSPSLFAFDLAYPNWVNVLAKYRSDDGFVSYARLKDDVKSEKNHPFDQFIADLQTVTVSDYNQWKAEDQKAFLINAYNALTVKFILDRYPVASIKELGGFLSSPWKRNFFSMLAGKYKNLERIEHELVSGSFKDPRTYSALCSGSVSSPRLAAKVYLGNNLDGRLDAALSEFLSDPSRNHYDVRSGTLEISKLFDWHGDDFKAGYGGVIKTVERFAPRSAQEAIHRGGRIHFLTWDWELNEPNGDRGVAVFVPAENPKPAKP